MRPLPAAAGQGQIGQSVRVSGDVEEPGSANRDDRPRPDADRSISSLLRQVDKGDRRGIEFCLVVVMPMVLFWLLILLAPPGLQLDIGERIGVGLFVTALWVPLWSLRNFWGTRYGRSTSRPRAMEAGSGSDGDGAKTRREGL